jgi:hypothetical protein
MNKARRPALASAAIALVSVLVVAGTVASATQAGLAPTVIQHKGGVKKDGKAKVKLNVTKSAEGMLVEVQGFKIKKFAVSCSGGGDKRVTIKPGSATISGDDLANGGTFNFSESGLDGSYQIGGEVKDQGAKTSGSFNYTELARGPGGIQRCNAAGEFKTKQR